ncbi:hypothetical protein ACN20G_15875 [Streptomyces sp. BI20]|uniref:hypothetical protein n=1 Tax=Streptomyces sp. BI20 TaxID=3403460 RepID=UPI003C77F6B4
MVGPSKSVATDATESTEAVCPAGTRVIGGGMAQSSDSSDTRMISSRPSDDGKKWLLTVRHRGVAGGDTINAIAFCQKVVGAD